MIKNRLLLNQIPICEINYINKKIDTMVYELYGLIENA